MPVKKLKSITKRAKKKTTKKQKVNKGTLSHLEKMELEFNTTPAKLVKQYRDELLNLKDREMQLAIQLKKALTLMDIAQKKNSFLKNTTSELHQRSIHRKQLIATEKLIKQLLKPISTLKNQITQIQDTIKIISQKKDKFHFIAKTLMNLDKQFKHDDRSTYISKKASLAAGLQQEESLEVI